MLERKGAKFLVEFRLVFIELEDQKLAEKLAWGSLGQPWKLVKRSP